VGPPIKWEYRTVSLEIEVDALRNVPMFKRIEPAKLRLLAFISERMQFRAGEDLCRQGEEGDSALIILDGSADVVVHTEEGDRTVAQFKENDIVGEIAILCDVPRTATVKATSDMVVLSVSKENFLKMLQEFPDMALEVMRVLAQRLELTTHALVALRSAAASP
jgi:CRP/FNR family cyclic AMP-dependent transcriptional regulator